MLRSSNSATITHECRHFRNGDHRMLKILILSAAIAAAVFSLSIVGFSAWRSFDEQQHQTNQKTGTKEPAEHSSNPKSNVASKESAEQAIARYNLWLMIFTGVLAFVSLIQIGFLISADRVASEAANAARQSADATRNSVKLAEKTAERQLRAYVFLDSEKIIEKLRVAAGEEPSFLLRVKNFGLTPAYNFVVVRATAIGPWPPDADLPMASAQESTQVLPPGEISYWGSSPDTPGGGKVTAEEFADMTAGRRRFYIFGRITYVDAFDKPRYTNFCLGIVPPSDPNSADFGLRRCPRQNDAN